MMLNNLRFKVEDFLLKKLHANIIIIQEFWVHDKDGRVIKYYKKHAHSLVGNFLQWMYTNFSYGDATNFALSNFNGCGGNAYTLNILGGGEQTYTTNWRIDALVGVIAKGFVFGTGIIAPSALDYKIGTAITHGTGAGQFSYQQQGASQAPIAVGNTTTFILQRIAVNNSAGAITVNEMALYLQNTGALFSICGYHDAVSPGIQVLATQTLTAQVTFQVVT